LGSEDLVHELPVLLVVEEFLGLSDSSLDLRLADGVASLFKKRGGAEPTPGLSVFRSDEVWFIGGEEGHRFGELLGCMRGGQVGDGFLWRGLVEGHELVASLQQNHLLKRTVLFSVPQLRCVV